MDLTLIRKACQVLGIDEPVSIEPDGTVWTGTDSDRHYPPMPPIRAEAQRIEQEQAALRTSAIAKLRSLGLTEQEVQSILGL